LVYKMSDDQGPEYFSSAEEVRWLASDWLENRHNEDRWDIETSSLSSFHIFIFLDFYTSICYNRRIRKLIISLR